VARFREFLGRVAERVEGKPPAIRAVWDDPKDDVIVASAVAARTDYLVAGDRKHLLLLGSYEGVRIVSVRDFVEPLAGRR
jgi:predicted nucleic acid-binding protein